MVNPTRTADLLASAVRILKSGENTFTIKPWRETMARVKSTPLDPNAPRTPKHARHAKKQVEAAQQAPIDTDTDAGVQSGFSVFNPVTPKEHMMSKADAEKTTSKQLGAEARAAAKAEREAAKAAKLAEKEAAKAEREAAAAAKKAEREAAATAKAEARAAAKAEREARLAELGPQGKMAALRDAKKSYVKSATGQLRSTDELAEALDAVPPTNVVKLALQVLALDANPYERLNVGQQSMNLRNKLRGAIRHGRVTIADVIAARDAGAFALTAEQLVKKPRATKAEEPAAEEAEAT